MEHELPQIQSQDACQSPGPEVRLQDEDNSIPMDLDSDTESAGPGFARDACPQDGSMHQIHQTCLVFKVGRCYSLNFGL